MLFRLLQSKKKFFSFFILSFVALKIEELQEALRKKEEEMKQMEERYKKYLEKAKSVSMSFWASPLSDYASLVIQLSACTVTSHTKNYQEKNKRNLLTKKNAEEETVIKIGHPTE